MKSTRDFHLIDTIFPLHPITCRPPAILPSNMPENTLKTFAGNGQPGDVMEPDGQLAESILTSISLTGIDLDILAIRLQRDCMQSIAMSWHRLMVRLSAMRTPASCDRFRGQAHVAPHINRR